MHQQNVFGSSSATAQMSYMSLDESNELNNHQKPEENALERANLEKLNNRKGKYEFDLKI